MRLWETRLRSPSVRTAWPSHACAVLASCRGKSGRASDRRDVAGAVRTERRDGRHGDDRAHCGKLQLEPGDSSHARRTHIPHKLSPPPHAPTCPLRSLLASPNPPPGLHSKRSWEPNMPPNARLRIPPQIAFVSVRLPACGKRAASLRNTCCQLADTAGRSGKGGLQDPSSAPAVWIAGQHKRYAVRNIILHYKRKSDFRRTLSTHHHQTFNPPTHKHTTHFVPAIWLAKRPRAPLRLNRLPPPPPNPTTTTHPHTSTTNHSPTHTQTPPDPRAPPHDPVPITTDACPAPVLAATLRVRAKARKNISTADTPE